MITPQIRIGPVTVHIYGLILAVAIYIGYLVAKKRAHIYKINPKFFDDPLLVLPLVLAIVGARAYHVLDYWQIYSKNLISILYIANGGLGIWGAIAGLTVGFYFFAKIRKLSLLNVLDLISPSLLAGQAIGRVGNYVNQEGFGPPTNLPWGIFISPQNRPIQYLNFTNFHPTFFYEAILNFIFFVLLIKLSQKFKKPGQAFGLYLIFYSTTRFIVEFWRIDTWAVGTIKLAHPLSLTAFLIGLYIFLKR